MLVFRLVMELDACCFFCGNYKKICWIVTKQIRCGYTERLIKFFICYDYVTYVRCGFLT